MHTKVQTLDASENPAATIGEYFYDGDGKRVKKVVAGGETTVFVYDAGGKLIGEYSSVVQTGSDAKTVYTTNDHLGSPRINTDATGQVISRHDYHPFGEEIARTGYGSDTIRKQFTGYERDDETSLDFAQARYFSSSHGRFSSPDPLAASADVSRPQSWNRYLYVENSPVRFTDKTGMMMDWVEKDGEMFYDSRVTSQASANLYYGQGATHRNNGYEYTASGGEQIELGDHGFFKEDGVIQTNGDRADGAPTESAEGEDYSSKVMAGGAILAAGQDSVGQQIAVMQAAALTALLIKAAQEITKIGQRPPGPDGVQYSLRAVGPGTYLCHLCPTGTTNLNPGEIWKYGETTQSNRYSVPELTSMAGQPVRQFNEISGTQIQIKVAEKVKLYTYFAANGHLPPGNRIFR